MEGLDGMYFDVYKDNAGEWRWRLHAGNGKLIANSGEGYKNKGDLHKAIILVKASKDAPIKGL